jgi:hypothetical protein
MASNSLNPNAAPFTPGAVQNRPLSPWAEPFGYNRSNREPVIEDAQRHSGLAPEWPSLHPKWYNDTPAAQGEPMTGTEKDKLFVTERFQDATMEGIYSWQVRIL